MSIPWQPPRLSKGPAQGNKEVRPISESTIRDQGSSACCTDTFFLFYSKGTSTLSWRFPPRQARQDLARTIHRGFLRMGWLLARKSMAVLCLLVPSWELTNGPLARQSCPEGEGDATDLSSAHDHSTGIPAHPIAMPELLCTVRHPVCLANSDTGRNPSRDRSGGIPDGRP